MKKTNPIADKQDEHGYSDRIFRGSGYTDAARFVRSLRRNDHNPSASGYTLGFRLVRNK
jgi:hypothetical protein